MDTSCSTRASFGGDSLPLEVDSLLPFETLPYLTCGIGVLVVEMGLECYLIFSSSSREESALLFRR